MRKGCVVCDRSASSRLRMTTLGRALLTSAFCLLQSPDQARREVGERVDLFETRDETRELRSVERRAQAGDVDLSDVVLRRHRSPLASSIALRARAASATRGPGR